MMSRITGGLNHLLAPLCLLLNLISLMLLVSELTTILNGRNDYLFLSPMSFILYDWYTERGNRKVTDLLGFLSCKRT